MICLNTGTLKKSKRPLWEKNLQI